MIARLQRFYGGPPADWLYNVPMGLLFVYQKALPAVHANEQINNATAVALGSGSMKRDDQKQVLQSLQQQAEKFVTRTAVPIDASALSEAGINVEFVD